MSIFRPPAAPQVIKHGIAALLPLTIGPTVPQGSTAVAQALAAYRPAAQPTQQMRPVFTQGGAAVAGPPTVGTSGVTQALAAYRPATTVQPAKPGPAVLLPVTIGPTIPAGAPATQQVQVAAALRTAAMPQQLQPKSMPPAVASGTPSEGPQFAAPRPIPWPYAQFTIPPTSTASAWGIPDVDLIFDRLYPLMVEQPAPTPIAALDAAQPFGIAVLLSPAAASVPPSQVLLPQERDWPTAATKLPATPQAALLASIAYSIGPQAVPVPGAQPWPYAAMQPARAVPLIAADFVLPSVTLMPQVQPWPYASTLLPAPVSAFFGITAVYGGAVPVLMGRALPFPYAATMLPTPTSSMWGQAASAVFPPPGQVLTGVIYGPNGNDYTGTLVQASGGSAYLRRR